MKNGPFPTLTAMLLSCCLAVAADPAAGAAAGLAARWDGKPPPAASSARQHLKAGLLLGSGAMSSPVPTVAYAAPTAPPKPRNHFSGTLSLAQPAAAGQVEVIRDQGGRVNQQSLQIRYLPPLQVELVQAGNDLLPAVRGAQVSTHPYWEWIIEPGKVWDEPGDLGYSRAVLPFSLQQRNANCTHNGLLSFLFHDSGRISRIAFQVASETCTYLQIDFWGMHRAHFAPHPVGNAQDLVAAWRQETANRLPVKDIARIGNDYPGVSASNFQPAAVDSATVWGVITDGVHYRGGCGTRYGPHPYCDVLNLPSYSTSKSTFAGLAFMYLARNHPGFAEERIVDWVPACAQSGQWGDVRFRHAIDMTTGVYTSGAYMVDEDNTSGTAFFNQESHAAKIDYSCTTHSRQQDPGELWVYHTTDTYVLGTAMNEYLKTTVSTDADIYADVVVSELWLELGLSPTTWTSLRTYDAVAQPFTGYGMTYLPDDIARIAQFLNMDDGLLNGQQVFEPTEFEKAMQRGPHLPVNGLAQRNLNYQNGFWAANARNWAGCGEDAWVPFMSGFGGITVALFPNDTVWYVFTDSAIFQWATPAAEANKIRPYCQ